MYQPPIAVATIAFRGRPFYEACERVAALGFKYIEPTLISSYDPSLSDEFFTAGRGAEMREVLESSGLQCLAVGAHIDMGRSSAAESLHRRLEFAASIGSTFVHSNAPSSADRETFLRNVEAILPHLDGLGLTLTLENPGDAKGELMTTGRDVANLTSQFLSPLIRLNYDPLNTLTASRGKVRPESEFDVVSSQVGHIHLKDLRRRGESWEYVGIGDGIVDYTRLLSLFSRIGSLTPMAVELPSSFHRNERYETVELPKNERPNVTAIERMLSRSKEFVESVVANSSESV